MTGSASKPSVAAIFAILSEAESAGVGKITRTALMKYLYLLDLYTARETGGKTWTGASWVFLHYGPYSQSLAEEVDALSAKGLIEEKAGGGLSKDYSLYSLAEMTIVKGFVDLGMPIDVRLSLSQDIRKFASDLPYLLDKIYFHTEPMECVRPGDALTFETAQKVNFKTDVKPIKIPIADEKTVTTIRLLAKRIGEKYLKSFDGQRPFAPPIIDHYFLDAVASDNGKPEVEGEFTAHIMLSGQ